jgi:hypothetical protein
MPEYAHIIDRDIVIIPKGKLVRISCCDCALVHDFKFNIHEGEIIVSIHRNDKETEKLRKDLKNA